LPWLVLAALLAVSLPLFVCMPLWGDVTLYDLAARNALQGGVPYRDIFDTNLPGMLWVHLAVRSVFGWSPEAIRLADFALVSAVVWLLVRWMRPEVPLPARGWAAVALYAFYFALTEWCHCQRDTWMLLPALGALYLRRWQLAGLTDPQTPARWVALRGLAEGLCWGAAFWIKPHVMVPALALYLVTAGLAVRAGARLPRLLTDTGCLLAGGLTAGALGALWLWQSGAWHAFWEILLEWDPEYYSGSGARLSGRPVYLLTRFFPWGLVHLAAAPLAVVAVFRALTAPAGRPEPATGRRALLGAFYLGWLVQAGFLQQEFDYVQVPAVLLALAVLAGWRWPVGPVAAGWVAGTALAATLPVLFPAAGPPLDELRQRSPRAYRVVFGQHHALMPGRVVYWVRCWQEGNTAELRDRLAGEDSPHATGWEDLGRVADYLRELDLRDGELTCYNNSTHPLYLDLGLRPSTRYLHFGTVLDHFPSRRRQVEQELAASGQRYVVSDLRAVGLTGEQPADCPPSLLRLFPWSELVVFRSGRYLVHRVRPDAGPVKLTAR
jgi:hypothetical protein